MTPKTKWAGFAGLVLAAGVAAAASPALTEVSQEARRACERKAIDVRPILDAPRMEAFIANCIADATWSPGNSGGKSDKSNKSNY